jgi:hypothetical protein
MYLAGLHQGLNKPSTIPHNEHLINLSVIVWFLLKYILSIGCTVWHLYTETHSGHMDALEWFNKWI